ncbi:cytochrome P450 CYP12A2-like isoform X4 [Leptidea sinapis]|uniref:cytochrome P450 CYP12A2-like isoform X4 n=1 Tax=Leptidea sinapis TaxID=189913 RepID=UPI0021C4BDC9|nr:cytochrome P450 CYP12A2-like isoform X4 [Leptidea sinapis]
MQNLRKSIVNVGVRNKKFTRSIAVNSTITDPAENIQLKSWQEIPGPSSLPFIGQLFHFLPGGSLSDDLKIPETLYRTYGPIVRIDGILGSPPVIFFIDAETTGHILRSENWLPSRPGFHTLAHFRKMIKYKDTPHLPTGLLTDEGELWKSFRSTVNPILLQPKTIKLYTNILNEVADDTIKRWRSKRNDNNMIDGKFDVEVNLWALESIGVVALGGRLNCLDPSLLDDSPARRLIQNVHDVFVMSEKLDFRPSLWRYIATPNYKKAMKCYAEQLNLSKYFINKAIEQNKNKVGENKDEKGVLEKLLEIDERVATIMAGDMLFAGVDTRNHRDVTGRCTRIFYVPMSYRPGKTAQGNSFHSFVVRRRKLLENRLETFPNLWHVVRGWNSAAGIRLQMQ